MGSIYKLFRGENRDEDFRISGTVSTMKIFIIMKHEIHTVKSFHIIKPFTLGIVFGNNNYKTINFLPILTGEMYGPLKSLDYFDKVMLDTEVNTIVWTNGADFDPALLYNWQHHIDELTQRAKKWKTEIT